MPPFRILLLFFLAYVTTTSACTLIIAGKNATSDGSVLIAHTDDAGGETSDLRLVQIPAARHEKDSKRAVLLVNGGFPRIVAKRRGWAYHPENPVNAGQNASEVLGYIDQVENTFAYIDQDYGMINEHQLIIGETTTGGQFCGWPKSRDYPWGKALFGIEELTKIALERCISARCAIETMGGLAVEFGFYSLESGNDPANPEIEYCSETLAIGDKFGEAWVFSVLTDPFGSSAIWAAQRVPDDQVAAAANSFIIRQMNLSDPDNFLASPGILKLAKETGRWDGRSEFDFHQAFGANGPLEDPKGSLYVGRRVWRVMDILAPSMRLDPYWGIHPNRPSYPFSIKPDMPVTRQKIYEILRDHYEGTEFDLTQGLAAGPFANPVRWDGDNKGVKGGWERAVSMFRTSFSFVALSRSFVPDEMAVVFYGQDAPHGTVYLPFYVAQTGWPDAWARGKQTVFDTASGWWAFNFVNQWRMLRWDAIGGDVRELRETLEAEIEDSWTRTERKALRALSKGKTKGALQRLTEFAVGTAESVLEKWWQLAWRLVAKYSNGYVTVGEKPGEQSAPGYPKEWLERTEFSGWPGRTFYKPGEEPKWGVRLPEGGRPNNGSNEPKKSNIDGMSLLVGAVGLLIVQTLVGLAVLGWKRYRSASERIQI